MNFGCLIFVLRPAYLVGVKFQTVDDEVKSKIAISLASNLARLRRYDSLGGTGTPRLDASMLPSQSSWMQNRVKRLCTFIPATLCC